MRAARVDDHARLRLLVDEWWGGRQMSGLLQPLFLENFSSTSLVAEASDGSVAAFLIGFVSADDPRVGYVHFVGVSPDARGRGLGRDLYDRFGAQVAALGVRRLRCVTSVVNSASVAFHEAIGFRVTGRRPDSSVDGGEYVQLERDVAELPSPLLGEVRWPPNADAALTGEWVELRPTVVADASELFDALDDEAVWRHLTASRPGAPAEMAAIVDAACTSMFPWTVRLRRPVNGLAAGAVVGWSTYLDASAHHARLELGSTAYSPRVWGSLVNPEAKLLLLGHAFDELGFGRLQLKTDIRNHRSQDAIDRLGAVREGVVRRFQLRADGTVRHTVLYSITADEWPDVRGRLEGRLARVS